MDLSQKAIWICMFQINGRMDIWTHRKIMYPCSKFTRAWSRQKSHCVKITLWPLQCFLLIRQSDSPCPCHFWVGCWLTTKRDTGREAGPAKQWQSKEAHERDRVRPSWDLPRPTGGRSRFLCKARPPQPSEPILIPKLRIQFANFPYLHYSMFEFCACVI